MEDNKKANADLFLRLYQEQLTQIRHYETQRSTIVTTIIAISAAIIGIITHDDIKESDLYLAFFLILIGVFGTGFLMRHSKRLKEQKEVSYKYRRVLLKLIQMPESKDNIENDDFKLEHAELMSMRKWWTGISVAVILIGCILFGQILYLKFNKKASEPCNKSFTKFEAKKTRQLWL